MAPTYDEISYGIPRLTAAGLVRVEGTRFRATPTALSIRRSVRAHVLGDVSTGVETALDQMGILSETEDRTLGRLPGFDEAQLEAAIRAHGRWFSFWSWPIMSLSEVLARFFGPRPGSRR
jgi:hypothetical protein